MIVTTTQHIEGKKIIAYKGVIAGEAILGANLFKDLFAGIRDMVGGRSGTYERELERARTIAFQELERLLFKSWNKKLVSWVPMRSSVLISTMKSWDRAMAC